MRILHIDSSIQGDASVSRRVSAAAVEQFSRADPDAELVYRDLERSPIAHLTLDAFAEPEAAEILQEFISSDIVVLGVAFYNFTIPSQLKSWFDRVLIPGKTFKYDDQGQRIGLAAGKRVIVALARGGLYGVNSPMAFAEHAETLVGWLFEYMGITDVEFIIAEGTRLGDGAREAAMVDALRKVSSLAAPGA